ncbi:MAG TPA: ATP-binding protein [Aggregatilinea sp.]|jgi:PAS domain S-box-containing protein|uniref:GAF domain-containing sensor histidine kinase n=1 Tax=Aggregatilinea sp. TaxID=2806333 RepID=UPI002C07843D|nr:ATP-binding protein [Aggregatilinea sp.]HML23094.1 ATP-binding protein [Aggregatilinea sp.]
MGTAQEPQAKLSDTTRLSLVSRLARELNSEMRPDDALRRVLNTTAEALGAPFASIACLKNNAVDSAYALGGDPQHTAGVMAQVVKSGLAGYVAYNRCTVAVDDITASPLWLALPDEPLSPQTGSALCAPLIHAGNVIAVMTFAHPTPAYFNTDAISLADTIAEMGATALTYTQLLETSRVTESRFASLFDDAIVPIIITDLQGAIQQVNRRAYEFLGYTRDELLARNIAAVHRMGTGPIGADRFAHLERGLEVRFQSIVWTKDGSSKPVQVYARRINSGKDDDRIQWIEHDMSSQIALEQLRQDLSLMVYHDMRGPLGNVYTSLEAIKSLLGEDIDPSVKSLLELASRAERQVRRMVDALLDVQRLEQGSKLISRENTGLSLLVNRAMLQVQPQAGDKDIRLRTALADDVPLLYIDDDMIERVIINLLDNAIKYTPEGGTVTLSTASGENEVYVRIKDTGPGIPAEAQPVIFDKFARVKQRNMPYGAGLGLAFCKLAVEAHGGRIWVHSEPGTGSTFTFALPLETSAAQETPLADTKAPS